MSQTEYNVVTNVHVLIITTRNALCIPAKPS